MDIVDLYNVNFLKNKKRKVLVDCGVVSRAVLISVVYLDY